MIDIRNYFAPQITAPGLQITVEVGIVLISGVGVLVPTQTVSLIANSTNYVYLNTGNGTILTNTSGFPSNGYPIAVAITSTNGIVSLLDSRPDVAPGVNTVTLETNGVANATQSLLNLQAGTGITLTADSSGDVTIATPAVVTSPSALQTINTFPLQVPLLQIGTASDTGLSRDSAGVIDVGNGTQGDKSGTLNLTELSAQAGGGTGLLPTITGATLVGDDNTTLGTGTGKAYGVIGIAKGTSDVVGDRSYGGWLKASASNNASTEVGLHVETAAGSGANLIEGESASVFRFVLTGLGVFNVYNGKTVFGNGVPSELAQELLTGRTANFNSGNPFTLFTPSVATMYRISAVEAITTAATTSCTMPSLTVGWTDAGGIARTFVLLAANSTNSTATMEQGILVIYTNASTAVTVTSAGYASSGTTAMVYDLAITAEAM